MKKTMILAVAAGTAIASGQMDVTTNGGFETGDTFGWQEFPTGASTFAASTDAKTGSFSGELSNTQLASALVVKQANLAVGGVMPGETIEISFAAKGLGEVGGVLFAEFFSEVAGGGTSSNEILGGAPLPINNDWQMFSFTTVAGADVSGGITLQFAAVTGGASGSSIHAFIDDVVVTPTPGAAAVLGLGGLMVSRRRR